MLGTKPINLTISRTEYKKILSESIPPKPQNNKLMKEENNLQLLSSLKQRGSNLLLIKGMYNQANVNKTFTVACELT